MKIGIIGLGDIAQKAYLPILSKKEGVELVLCTRNADKLSNLSEMYRIREKVQTVDELISKDIDAAFVCAATDAHYEIAEKLLLNGIHTYIDKPISMNFHESERIVKLSNETGKIAMVGFNRRFIPKVKELKEHGKASFIMVQKNRFAFPDHIRKVVVEDFIHVIDTLRFLMNTNVKNLNIEYLRNRDMLNHVVVNLVGEGCTAVGIMNRNGGVTEEIIEYTTGHDKYVVNSLVETTHFHNKEVNISRFGDWESTLYKRGFYQIVDYFIDCVQNNRTPDPSIDDSLLTHQICEKIVKFIDADL